MCREIGYDIGLVWLPLHGAWAAHNVPWTKPVLMSLDKEPGQDRAQSHGKP